MADTTFVIPGTSADPLKGTGDKLGWNRPRIDAREVFKAAQKREPNQAEQVILHRMVQAARTAQTTSHSEKDFEGAFLRLGFYLKNLREARRQEVDAINAHADAVVRAHTLKYYAEKPKSFPDDVIAFLEDVGGTILEGVHTISSGAASLYGSATDLVDKVPFVGTALHAGMDLAGGGAIKTAAAIANGDNVSRTAVGHFKDTLANTQTVAQYATTVTSLVPGIGTIASGVTGALAAASALSEGKPITEALIAACETAVLANIPGGAIGQKIAKEAFAVAKGLASGDSIDKIAMDRARAQLPASAQKAFDVGLAVMQGKKLQEVLINGVANLAPAALGKLTAEGNELLKHAPALMKAAQGLEQKAQDGFKLASSVLARTGVSPQAISAFRAKLAPLEQKGFDVAVAFHAKSAHPVAAIASAALNMVPAPTQTAPVKPPATQGPRPFDGSVPVPLTQEQRDLQALAKLTPAQQKQLVEYANLQKLAKLTPAQQQQLVAYAKAIAATPATQAALRVAATTPSLATPGPAKPATPGPAKPATPARASEASKTAALSPSVAASAYPPYPPHLTGALSAPPPHPHPGGRHHPGRHPGVFRGGRAVPGWWNSWGGTQVVTTTETCRIWGDPVEIPQSMQVSAKVALGASGGRPTTLRGEDGVLYLFTSEGGGIVARPCAAMAGALGDPGTTWGPVTTDMSREMRWAGMSAVNGTKGRPRMVIGPDGADYLFAMENGTLTARRAV